MLADQVLPHLHKVRSTGKNSWVACCCCHEDKTPSMTLTEQNDTLLIHCFGCGANGKDVCDALGLDPFILFADSFTPGEYKKPRIPAADILRCLDFEILFMSMVNRQLEAGQPLREEDKERLKLTESRINAAMTVGELK